MDVVTGHMNAFAQLGVPRDSMTLLDDGRVAVPRDVYIRIMDASKSDAVAKAREAARLAAEVRRTEGTSAGMFALIAAFQFWGAEDKVRARFSADDDVDLFDVDKFIAVWERGGSGYVHAATFVLHVFGSETVAARFHLHKAVQSMDAERRAVVSVWTEEPWWA